MGKHIQDQICGRTTSPADQRIHLPPWQGSATQVSWHPRLPPRGVLAHSGVRHMIGLCGQLQSYCWKQLALVGKINVMCWN